MSVSQKLFNVLARLPGTPFHHVWGGIAIIGVLVALFLKATHQDTLVAMMWMLLLVAVVHIGTLIYKGWKEPLGLSDKRLFILAYIPVVGVCLGLMGGALLRMEPLNAMLTLACVLVLTWNASLRFTHKLKSLTTWQLP